MRRWSRSCSLTVRVLPIPNQPHTHRENSKELQTKTTHFRRLLSSITHLMPSIVQFEHVTSPSAVMWYLCITSHRTFLALHAAHAFAALLLTGLGFPLLSRPALDWPRFFKPESVEAGDWEPAGSSEAAFSEVMMSAALSVRREQSEACG